MQYHNMMRVQVVADDPASLDLAGISGQRLNSQTPAYCLIVCRNRNAIAQAIILNGFTQQALAVFFVKVDVFLLRLQVCDFLFHVIPSTYGNADKRVKFEK